MVNKKKITIDSSTPPLLPAGEFSSWLRGIRCAQKDNALAMVPCGECNACCRSHYFIHIKPDETRTLSRIPKKLLFPAPGMPKGNVLMGYDEHGRCPMLAGDTCTIYDDRPETCRSYDCRIFPAAGITTVDSDKELIDERIRRWNFSYTDAFGRKEHKAVMAAAEFLWDNAERFPAGFVPSNSTQLAVLAIKVYDVFLDTKGGNGEDKDVRPAEDIVIYVMDALKRFEAHET